MNSDNGGPEFPVVELNEHWTVERAAEAAYELADAMLKERAMTREPDFWFACFLAVILASVLVFGPGGCAS